MKKLILILLVALCASSAAYAQKDIWGKGRYFNIGYSIAQTAPENSYIDKGKFGVSITKGTTYLFPKTPFANMVKVGFDVNWMDISVAKYKATAGWENEFLDENYDNDYDNDGDFDINIGRLSLLVGAFGIGPNVTVAPFASFNNQARFLKASLYFHYQPTFGAYMVLDDGDMEASYAYCNMFQFGGKIQWKFIGVGIEGHWGSGKFKQLEFDMEDEYNDFFGESSTGKINRRFANTRIYLSLSF